MKISDYIVNELKKNGIRDFFGYQGTMIAYFIDSICKDSDVKNHVCYNEQGAALEAVGYSKSTGKLACAYSTSGPGATNLITGIADAYYDSCPIIFITGQLNTHEYTNVPVRQQGFQESNIVDMVESITKYAVQITKPEQVKYELHKAINIACSGRKGPVLLDIPMNIQKTEFNPEEFDDYNIDDYPNIDYNSISKEIIDYINMAESPIFMLGNGISISDESINNIRQLVDIVKIPVLYSMLGKSLIEDNSPYNFGFMGSAYGVRYANIIGCKKADLIISLGCRLNGRTIGLNKSKFNPNAKIIRIEIDLLEQRLPVHDDIFYTCDVNELIKTMLNLLKNKNTVLEKNEWLEKCNYIKNSLINIDYDKPGFEPNKYIDAINNYSNDSTNFYVDVGQNQIWAAHSIKIKKNQKIIFSGGFGAMGFSLPAAIGGYIANHNRSIVICGDGGMQMNIQELQTIVREKLPLKIIIFNNQSLGLIHQQQTDFFDSKYYGASEEGGYLAPDFEKIGNAYGIHSITVYNIDEFCSALNKNINSFEPCIIQVMLYPGTKAYPKTYFGNEMVNQKPELSNELLNNLINI